MNWKLVGALLCVAAQCFSQPVADAARQIGAHERKAREFLGAKRPDLAAREYEAIIAFDAKNADAQGNLGVLLFFNADYAKAAPHLRAALIEKPALWKIQALLGMSEKRVGQPAAALTDLEASFPKLDEEKLRRQVGLELIELYAAAGDLDKAAGVVGALRRLLPADGEILYAARRIYGDLADDATLRLATLAPGSARMHQLMAHEMMRQGYRDAAIEQYREALRIDPQATGLHFELAEAYFTASDNPDLKAAESEYRAALAANPFDARSECQLGEIALRGPDAAAAFQHFSRCLELQPDDVDANLGLAKTLLLMNESQKAQRYLERSVQLDPLREVAHYRLAAIYRAAGRTADADRELAEFRRLKTLKSNLREVYKQMRVHPLKEEQADADVPK
ncbi:MAG: tetratricopeptide repeat protein [Bryobacteraceae bacterium]|nr:tetratricopeptide repeat protein [Bryobacteraceae bacterium]